MATFEKLCADRLLELRAGSDTNKCQYDACIARLTDIIKADIGVEHQYLRDAVTAASKEFSQLLAKNKHEHLVTQALKKIQDEEKRTTSRTLLGGRSPGPMSIVG